MKVIHIHRECFLGSGQPLLIWKGHHPCWTFIACAQLGAQFATKSSRNLMAYPLKAFI
jgi:hypothetical protein